MKKFEAKTLEDAYAKAAEAFGCSVTELEYEVVQHPSSGFLGLFAKPAMIVALARREAPVSSSEVQTGKPAVKNRKPAAQKEKRAPKREKATAVKSAGEAPAVKPSEEKSTPAPVVDAHTETSNTVLESFFDTDQTEDSSADVTLVVSPSEDTATDSQQTVQLEIEERLAALIKQSCFDIDVVEVDVIENTAYIFIDGEDAALLIGKEGYRYNALAYLISNWLQNQYKLYIKLEIAQFLASQQEMIRSYMEPVIEHVEQEGWGRTRALDGVLVQIALEQLREEFPNKYVAIKRTRNGDRYVLINEFNKRS